MTGWRAGLLLRLDPADPDQVLLRLALDRALAAHPGIRFASLFVEASRPPAPQPVESLRVLLERTGRLDATAEITWHGRPCPAVAALGANRLSLPRSQSCWPPGPFALDLGPRDLERHAADEAWLRRLMAGGLVHLGLGDRSLPAEPVRRLDALAQLQGFRRYETLHWALPGHEARWLADARQGQPIMGLGPAAYGRWPSRTGWCWWRAAPGRRWRDKVAAGGDGRGRLHRLSARQRAQERLIDGLRLAVGFDPGGIAAETGLEPAAWLDEAALAELLAASRMRRLGSCLAATDLGQADELALQLLT